MLAFYLAAMPDHDAANVSFFAGGVAGDGLRASIGLVSPVLPGFTWTYNPGCHLLIPALGATCHLAAEARFTLGRTGGWTAIALGGVDGGWTGEVRLSSSLPVELRGKSAGGAFFQREGAFEGTAKLLGELPPFIVVKALTETSVKQYVGRELFGYFVGSSYSGLLKMGYDGPTASAEGAYAYYFHGASSGSYRFRIDYNYDASVALWYTPVWLLVADVGLMW